MGDELGNESELGTSSRRRGRPRNTPEHAARVNAERKAKYWGEERNARRRETYANDPAYAEKARVTRRASHAKATGKAPNVSCIENAKIVDTTGSLRAVKAGSSVLVIGRVFTQTDTARLLERQPQVVYRWQQRGIFPSPTLVDDMGNRYFADDEVRAFVELLGRHQFVTPHYRIDHVEVKDQLFAAAFCNRPVAAAAWVNARATTSAASRSHNDHQHPAS